MRQRGGDKEGSPLHLRTSLAPAVRGRGFDGLSAAATGAVRVVTANLRVPVATGGQPVPRGA